MCKKKNSLCFKKESHYADYIKVMRLMAIESKKDSYVNSFSIKNSSYTKSKLLVKKMSPGIEFDIKTSQKRALKRMTNYFKDKKNHFCFKTFGFTSEVDKSVKDNMKNTLKIKITST